MDPAEKPLFPPEPKRFAKLSTKQSHTASRFQAESTKPTMAHCWGPEKAKIVIMRMSFISYPAWV